MTLPGKRPTGLGRGLSSLIPQRPPGQGVQDIPIDRVRHNPYQPRVHAEREALEALAASIAEHGVLQPILVVETIDGYQLIAGERRLRAAELVGLERIPALVRGTVAERHHLELALIENLQRSDLNPLEEARAFRQLIADFGLTQEQVAERVGRARSSVTNTLRLLDLAEPVQDAVAEGLISEGHARALAGLERPAQQEALLALVLKGDLSVRQTEELARRLKSAASAEAAPRGHERDPDVERLENDLRSVLGTKVTLASRRKGGRIIIEYYNADELGRLTDRLMGKNT
ncbi:MAG: ParB/RepB/Spo0J family partition protein [Candidatus Limnocylindrales bacterium]